MLVRVKYRIATYSVSTCVSAEPDEDDDTIIAKLKARLKHDYGESMPHDWDSFEIIKAKEADT